jgi:uncharacterized protein (TIGR03435 family)
MKWLIFCCVLAGCAASGQTPSFEVASVKPAPPPGESMRVLMKRDAKGVNLVNVTFRNALAIAYNVKERQIACRA